MNMYKLAKHRGDLFNLFFHRPVRQLALKFYLADQDKRFPTNDVSVVIAVRNRLDYRLPNLLQSLRAQTYSKDLIKIIVVDYGSDLEIARGLNEICQSFGAHYLFNDAPEWHKTHALNIALRHSRSKYVLVADVDMIFERNYIEEAIRVLELDSLGLVLSTHLDLKKGDVDQKIDVTKDYARLKSIALPRATSVSYLSTSICMARRFFFRKVRGFDEFYKAWGAEDDDFVERLESFGLRIKDISSQTSFLHQWHPLHEGQHLESLGESILKNRKYFESRRPIFANPKGWGRLTRQLPQLRKQSVL